MSNNGFEELFDEFVFTKTSLNEVSNILEILRNSIYDSKDYRKAVKIKRMYHTNKFFAFLIGETKYEKCYNYTSTREKVANTYVEAKEEIDRLGRCYGFYGNDYKFGELSIYDIRRIDSQTRNLKNFVANDIYAAKLKQIIERLKKDVDGCIEYKKQKDLEEEQERLRQQQRQKERYDSFFYSRYSNSYYDFNRRGNNSWGTPPPPPPPKNNGIPYEVKKAFIELGVPSGSDVSVTIIKKAYKKMALQHHPDRGGSVDKMAEINNHYDIAIKWLNRNK